MVSKAGGEFKGTLAKKIGAALLWLIPLILLLSLALKFIGYGYPFSPHVQLPPQGWDDWAHLHQTFEVYHRIETTRAVLPALRSSCSSVKWPPLFYLLTAKALQIWYDVAALYLVMFVLAVGCLLAIYALARIYLDDKRLALLTVVLFTANPVWLESALSYNLETILLLGTAAFMALLFSLPPQRNAPWALVAGALGGLMLLTKTVILIPLLPAALGYFARTLRRGKSGALKSRGNPLLFLLPALLIALWWYPPQSSQWQNFISTDLANPADSGESPFYYLYTLLFDFISLPLLIAALVALISGRENAKRFLDDRRTLALLLGAFFGLLFFSLIGTKHEWYLLPPYLLLALPALRLIGYATKSVRRALVIALFVIYGGMTLYFAAWEMPRETSTRWPYPAGHSVLRVYENFKPPITVVAHQIRAHFPPEEMVDLAILALAIDDNFDWQAMQIIALHDPKYVPFLFDITLAEHSPPSWERLQTIIAFIQPGAVEATCATLKCKSARQQQSQFCARFPNYLREHFREVRRIPIVPDFSLAVFRRVP